MKTPQEIKDEIAIEDGFQNWEDYYETDSGFSEKIESLMDRVCERYAIEMSRESVNNTIDQAISAMERKGLNEFNVRGKIVLRELNKLKRI